jgi:Heterokaryon incompatibility protein (HET)
VCEKCYDLLAGIEGMTARGKYSGVSITGDEVRTLLCDGSDGCHLFCLIATVIAPPYKALFFPDTLSKPDAVLKPLKLEYFGEPRSKITLASSSQPIITLRYVRLKDLTATDERFITPAVPHTKSDESNETIRTWIDECLNRHPECVDIQSARIKNQLLPSRLVHIGPQQDPCRIKICTSAHLNSAVRYATLSHVWGTSRHLTLTSKNKEKLQRGISMTELPGTFRHAVELTESLSLQYLWIDSLCIVQDSTSDWERECKIMGDIYSSAFINIAASAATDSDGGLFAPREPLEMTPCVVSIRFKERGRQDEPYVFWAEDQAQTPIADAPLNKRAWVLQERLLAPRTVHFTRPKIFWECKSLLASETDPYSHLEHHQDLSITQRWIAPLSKHLPLDQQSAECLEKWNNAVMLYSSASLTYQSDKLVAISGVARHIYSLWPDSTTKYLAGIWSHKLVFSLLWNKIEPTSSSLRLKKYRAPSWSWAAINGEIHLNPDRSYVEKQIAFIKEARTSPINDPFGAVDGGSIHIKGPLCTAVLKCPFNTSSTPSEVRLESTDRDIASLKLMFDYSDPELYESSGTYNIYLLGIESNDPEYAYSYICGLILQPSGDQRGQYVRLGCFTDAGPKDIVEREQKSASPRPETWGNLSWAFEKSRLAESLYLESHDDNTFTIEII